MSALEAAAVATPAEGTEGTVSVPPGTGAAEGSIPAETVVPGRAVVPPGGESSCKVTHPKIKQRATQRMSVLKLERDRPSGQNSTKSCATCQFSWGMQ